MVTGEDHHIIRVKALNKVDVLIDSIGSTLVPAAFFIVPFVGRQDLGAAMGLVQTPGLTIANIFIELQGLILGQNTHSIDAGIDAITKGKIDNAIFTAEGNGRFGSFFCQDLQAASLTTGQKHCDTTFFLEVHNYSSLCLMRPLLAQASVAGQYGKKAHFHISIYKIS